MNSSTESRLSRTTVGTGTQTRTSTVTRYALTPKSKTQGFVLLVRRIATQVWVGEREGAIWLKETVSASGLLLFAALIVGSVIGFAFGLVEGFVVAGIAVVLIVLCIPFLLGGHDYDVELRLERDRVVAGSELAGSLSVTNQGTRVALPGIIDIPVGDGLVEVHVPLLRTGASHDERLMISAQHRGIIDVGPMTISRGDPLGILRRELSWPQVQRVFVHPVTVSIPSTSAGLIRDLEGAPTSILADSDLSFHAIREYMTGDSQRHVHWKATAKTGRLMVRQFEESRHSRIAVVLDLDSDEYESDDEFEMAVSAAASLGVQGIREGRDVLCTTSAHIPEFSRITVQSIVSVPTRSDKAFLDGTSGIERGNNVMRLEAVAALTAQSFPELSIAFVLSGSRQPLARLRHAAIGFPTGVAIVAVRCEPEAEPSLRSTPELTVMTIGALHDLKHMLARGALR